MGSQHTYEPNSRATKEEALRALRTGTKSAPLMTYASTETPVELARRYDKIIAAIASQFRDLVNMTLNPGHLYY